MSCFINSPSCRHCEPTKSAWQFYHCEDLARKIALLLGDEPFRTLLAQNAFKDALNYDENTIAEKYLRIYDEALRT